ncbi:MAG: hypothetical protein ACYC6N_18665 [Pirellulaceae bacterium]
MRFSLALLTVLSVAFGGQLAPAAVVTSQLTGDIRPENPDDIFVNVSITFDDLNDTTADWVIDIDSPAHPDIKLHEFYFNLGGILASDITFGPFVPDGWAVSSPATVQGAGGAAFLFEVLDPAGPPNADDVTNSQNLEFTATLTNGDYWNLLMFTSAATAESNDAGQGQLGAHLGGLVPVGATQGDGGSGFAFGDFTAPSVHPEPASFAIWGIITAICGALTIRRRRRT